MGFRIIANASIGEDKDPMEDYVFRHQVNAMLTEDRGTVYKHHEIKIEDGPVNPQTKKRALTTVRLKYALDQPFIFACFADNLEGFETRQHDEWMTVARDAIQRFAAMRGFTIKFGPRQEDNNRYNVVAELDKVIEEDPETVRLRAEAEREAAKAAARHAEIERRMAAAAQRAGR